MNFKELNKICAVTSLLNTFVLAACQGPVAGDTALSSEVVNAEKPSTVMAVIQDAVIAVGEGLVAQQGRFKAH